MTLAKQRAKYYQCLFTYLKRRDGLREKYKFSMSKKNTEYGIAVDKINIKIKHWKRMIRLIDQKTVVINHLIKSITSFYGYSLKANRGVRATTERAKIAKSLYYKYGLENTSITAKNLKEHIGAKRESQPYEWRKKFTNSFQTTPQNKELYLQFKYYMNQKRNQP